MYDDEIPNDEIRQEHDRQQRAVPRGGVGAYMQRAPQIGQQRTSLLNRPTASSRLGAGGIGLDSAAGGAQTGRQPVIEATFNEHDLSIEQLWQLLQALEVRLAPVLAPTYPTDNAKVPGQPQPVLPPLAERLGAMTIEVLKMAGKVRELIDRLEV